ncbi:hypothetical protein PG987_005962 [Apiospora arundinis]
MVVVPYFAKAPPPPPSTQPSSSSSSSSPEASTSTSTPSEPCWASPWDFDAHRDVITRLYIHEAKSLNQVAAIMAQDYNFRATDRMYKRRFAEWNLRKNKKYTRTKPKSSQARALVSHPRQRAAAAHQGPDLSSSPIPSFLLAPESIRLPETVFKLTGVLVAGNSENYIMRGHLLAGMHLLVLTMRSATRAFELGDFPLAFKVMQRFFDQLMAISAASHGRISYFIIAFLVMLRVPEDIAVRVLEFICHLVAIRLPSSHPIVLIWRTILKADRQVVWDNAFSFIDAYFDRLQAANEGSQFQPMLKNLAAIMCDPEMYYGHKRKSLTSPSSSPSPPLAASGPGISSSSSSSNAGSVTAGTVEEERTVLVACKRCLGPEWQALHDRLATAHAHLAVGEAGEALALADEVSAVCETRRGEFHYDVLQDRSLALRFRAATRPGSGSSLAECRRAAARYTQHTLELAGIMEGVVSPEMTETLESVIQPSSSPPSTDKATTDTPHFDTGDGGGGDAGQSTTTETQIHLADATMRPSPQRMMTRVSKNDPYVLSGLINIVQKLSVDGMEAFTTALRLQLEACEREKGR